MKTLEYLPKEFKVLQEGEVHDRPDGRYLMPHAFIKNYFLEITVNVTEREERVSIRLIMRQGKKFRNVNRYMTWHECMMVRDLYWEEGEKVIQIMGVNDEEEKAGMYFTHLIKELGEVELLKDDLAQTKAAFRFLEEANNNLEKQLKELRAPVQDII